VSVDGLKVAKPSHLEKHRIVQRFEPFLVDYITACNVAGRPRDSNAQVQRTKEVMPREKRRKLSGERIHLLQFTQKALDIFKCLCGRPARIEQWHALIGVEQPAASSTQTANSPVCSVLASAKGYRRMIPGM